MPTLMLDSSFGGAGSTMPPITDERTPDGYGHESDWKFWESQLKNLDKSYERIIGLGLKHVKHIGSGAVAILHPELPVSKHRTPYPTFEDHRIQQPNAGVYYFK